MLPLQSDFNLTYAQLGLLPALYMAGLMVAAVIFNELTNHYNSFRLVGERSITSTFFPLRAPYNETSGSVTVCMQATEEPMS